jgi:NDP-sugar pyrophosphorylase family protein
MTTTPVAIQAVILAGGLATRMLPRTETVPKALLEVAGRPFIDWQLELIARTAITDVVMCVAHLADRIRDHVCDGSKYGLRVTYCEDTLLGTAGALRGALSHLADEFLVTYGDSYLRFDYAEPVRMLTRNADCDGVLAIYRNAGRHEVSNVITDGTWVLRYDKQAPDPAFDHVDYGAMALRRNVIAALPAGKKLGLDSIQRDLAARSRLRAFVARERFYEIGSPQGLAELDAMLLNPLHDS